MSPARPGPHNLHALPTLTEVIELPAPAAGGPGEASPDDTAAARTAPAFGEQELVERVLADVLRHADLMFEYRLRDALTPTLARLTEALVRELRQELAATLRDVVARAVTQELARRRSR